MKLCQVKWIVHDLLTAKSSWFFIKREIYGRSVLHFFKVAEEFSLFGLLPQIKVLISNSQTAKYFYQFKISIECSLIFKKSQLFWLIYTLFWNFVTFYKINKMMLFIIISTLKDEKVHFKWLYEENPKLEMNFKGSPPILASVLL